MVTPVDIARYAADFGRHLATSLDGNIFEWNSLVFCNPGLASPYRNMVVPLRPVRGADLPELGRKLADFYPASVKWVLWSPFPDDLRAAGLHEFWVNPSMLRAEVDPLPDVTTPAGFRITQVRTNADLHIFERVRDGSYAGSPGLGKEGRPLDTRALRNGFQLWLGWQDTEPVATAAAFSNGQLNAIKWVSTLPAFRGKRIGAAMTTCAVNSASLPAVLDSEAEALGLYQRLGFTAVGQIRFWRPAS